MTYNRTLNDTESPIEDTLTDETKSTIDITGAEVRFYLKKPDGAIVTDDTSGNVTIVDSGAGDVKYEFAPGDLDQVGLYYYEWEVDFSTGGPLTFPGKGKGETISVRKEID